MGGELRGGKRLEDRVKEAVKMGFRRIIVPKSAGLVKKKASATTLSENVLECSNLFEAVALSFADPEVAQAFTNSRSRSKGKKKAYSAEMRKENGGDAVNKNSNHRFNGNDSDGGYGDGDDDGNHFVDVLNDDP